MRGKTTASNYEFTQTPTGIVTNADGTMLCIKIQKGIGLRSRLVRQVYYDAGNIHIKSIVCG